MERLLYFSLNSKTREAFHSFVEKGRFEYGRYPFRLYSIKESSFTHISDLGEFLSRQSSLSKIKILIDYVSLTRAHEDSAEGYVKNAQDTVRRLILRFPEVFFMFDETGLGGDDYPFDFSDFLFPLYSALSNQFLFKEYHQFRADLEKNPFSVFARSRNNLFDGSNLRYVTKRFLYDELKTGKHNFGIIQSSRASKLALCIEEEDIQNRFNCYALYCNGFRSLPVLSARELIDFNSYVKSKKISPAIITRDFDLQFDDIPPSASALARELNINEVDLVRGYKFDESTKTWTDYTSGKETLPNPYWSNLKGHPIVFVTKGTERMPDDCSSVGEVELVNCKSGGNELHVRTIRKPVPGLYFPFRKFDDIKTVSSNVLTCENKKWLSLRESAYRVFYDYYSTLKARKNHDNVDVDVDDKLTKTIEKYKTIVEQHEPQTPLRFNMRWCEVEEEYYWTHQLYSLKTSRAGHDHGVPLNVYDMVKDMVDRAKVYYEEKRYIRSSILSWEAIEVMNGFHEVLTLEAYYIYALSENAIAMRVLGGKESVLTEDTSFRVRKIRADVNRLLFRHGHNTERRKLALNVLNQIFSDCRAFCKQKEHFESEEEFLSAIGHLNSADLTWNAYLKLSGRLYDWYWKCIYKKELDDLESIKKDKSK